MEYTQIIRATQCGFDPFCSFEQLIGIIQDAVTDTLGEMGCGNITLRHNYHAMWVFSRHRIRVYRLPTWGERIAVSCELGECNRAAAYLVTVLRSEDGTLLAESMLEACVIDTESFRIQRLDTIPFTPRHSKCETRIGVPAGEMSPKAEFTVKPSIMDMSMHMNNAKGLSALLDSFSPEELRELYASPFECCIQYHAQAFHGQKLSVLRGESPSEFAFAYCLPSGDKILSGYVQRISL